MRKEVDYIEAFRQELAEMKNFKADEHEPFPYDDAADLEELHLRIKKQEIINSQYTRICNKERWHLWIDVIYPYLELEAALQGLQVVLEVDEEKYSGKITIKGDRLFLSKHFSESQSCLETMIHFSNDFWISNENGLFVIEILFDLYDKEKTSDKTEEIENAQKEFDAFRLQHGKTVKFKFNP